MLGAVELCNNAMQVDPSSADDASDVSVMQNLADRAVLLASVRQVETTAPVTLFSTPASSAQVLAPAPPQALTALPQLLRSMQGTLFLQPAARTCIQSWYSLEWWVVPSVSNSRVGRRESF